MSLSDYEKLIAQVIAKHLKTDESLSARVALGLVVFDLADRFIALDPTFCREAFLRECEVSR